jgi:hypothetical protein
MVSLEVWDTCFWVTRLPSSDVVEVNSVFTQETQAILSWMSTKQTLVTMVIKESMIRTQEIISVYTE